MMRGGIVHSDATLVQVDVIFKPRVELSIYERRNTKISLIKQGGMPIHGMLIRAIVVAHDEMCQSSVMIAYPNDAHVL